MLRDWSPDSTSGNAPDLFSIVLEVVQPANLKTWQNDSPPPLNEARELLIGQLRSRLDYHMKRGVLMLKGGVGAYI